MVGIELYESLTFQPRGIKWMFSGQKLYRVICLSNPNCSTIFFHLIMITLAGSCSATISINLYNNYYYNYFQIGWMYIPFIFGCQNGIMEIQTNFILTSYTLGFVLFIKFAAVIPWHPVNSYNSLVLPASTLQNLLFYYNFQLSILFG